MTTENKKMINSEQYWEHRFNTDWEENSGRQQTLYFCQLAESMFPDWFNTLLIEGASVADIGCAEGDCTHFLASRYPKSTFTGIDFSETAIRKARMYYPDQLYLQQSIQDIDLKFDIVFSSNTLEHFKEPFEILKHLFRISNKYVAILIPFQEYERFKEHFYTFDYHDFDINVDKFSIVFAEEHDCGRNPNIYWAGKQILLIYAHKDILPAHKLTLKDYINSLSSNYNTIKQELDNIRDQAMKLEERHNEQVSISTSQQETLLLQAKLVEQLNKEKEEAYKEKVELIKEKKQLIEETKELYKEITELTKNNEKAKVQVTELISEKKTLEQEIQQLNLVIEIADKDITKLKEEQGKISELLNDFKLALSLRDEDEISVTREIKQQKNQIEWLLSEKYRADIELQAIKSSTLWAFGAKYYAFRDRTPLVRDVFKALRIWRRYGFKSLVKRALFKMKNTKEKKVNGSVNSLFEEILTKYNSHEIDGLTIIPSAFEFKELYNQRTINLAKYLSTNNKAVFFVVWQWSKEDNVAHNFQEVYPNVYQIALYDFFDNIKLLDHFSGMPYKKAVLNIPSKNWGQIIIDLKTKGFEVVYDIMDDWEEFHKVGQADWFQKEFEEFFILNAERVFAVSQALVNKFKYLREDIICVGNGYYTSLLGEENRDISLSNLREDGKVVLGYFGHLTESWFDWELIEKILLQENYIVEIIGYGAKEETIARMKKNPNFKYIGTVNPGELHNYVKNWDIGLIPFKESSLSVAVDPIKVYEYIYFGLKVIVTGIPHLHSYPNVFLYEQNTDSIEQLIKNVYEQERSKELDKQIDIFLKKTTWENRFEELLGNPTNCYMEIYNHESN
ncbi:methyltransferase domain-containing protein [Paenibacillus woosongensis]|uniref:Methyltransferase domain-containing protein n=1 Tax=Paenibacillus woosongensis TaxID=307580 RepID=A0A7X2Z557_9BACL|nr:methyltransferase domain-containing protein [Paenibacillus woosongensis]MUG47198.1 methyltransferase domain-containing protein [Paenibacillus woosongensis]